MNKPSVATRHIVTAHFRHEDGTEVTVNAETREGGFDAIDAAISALQNHVFYFRGKPITERHVLDEWELLVLFSMRAE